MTKQMQSKEQEELDIKQNPFSCDERVYSAIRHTFEAKDEQVTKVYPPEFIEHFLKSNALPGVKPLH